MVFRVPCTGHGFGRGPFIDAGSAIRLAGLLTPSVARDQRGRTGGQSNALTKSHTTVMPITCR